MLIIKNVWCVYKEEMFQPPSYEFFIKNHTTEYRPFEEIFFLKLSFTFTLNSMDVNRYPKGVIFMYYSEEK